MNTPAARLIDELDEALGRERLMLLEGRFDALIQAARLREDLTAKLERYDAAALRGSSARLERVRIAAARNVRLLRAAMEGAAAGRKRVREIGEARTRLSGYDASGAPVEHMPARALGRRA
jgi:hypothetical protein